MKRHRFLSIILVLTMLMSLLSPGMSVSAAGEWRNWKQTAGYWSSYIMGSGSATVATYGCTSTSVAMAAVQLGCESESNFDPGIFVTRMNNIGGYTKGGGMYWAKMHKAIPNMPSVKDITFSAESTEQRINTIAGYRNAGYAVIIVIHRYTDSDGNKHWHYVLADKVENGELYILDPGGANGNIKTKYASSAVMIHSIQVYKNSNTEGYKEVVVPPVNTHTCQYSRTTESSHPHRRYDVCSCGKQSYVGTSTVSSCSSCYPVGSVTLSRSYQKTKGTVTFKRNNVQNANGYRLELYQDGGLYKTYTMSDTELKLTNLPSGSYSARLYAKNSNTGEERFAKCNSFRLLDTYKISYNANGGSGAPLAGEKIQDSSFTLSAIIPKKTGHIFKGWATSKNATKAKYQPGDAYTKNAKITLYAVWEPETYTVKFDANGGDGELADVTITYGDTMKMPNSVIRSNYYLRGWSKTANASTPDYKLGMDYKITENCTLYAVWGSSTWGGDVAQSFAGGDGSAKNPYQISSAAELGYFASVVNSQASAPEYKYYVLTDNINLAYTQWVPIGLYGNENQYFYGSFDANGYTISDLYITAVNEGYVGLFGYVKDSEIKNLNVSGVIENIISTANVYVGSVAGYADNTSIKGCSSMYFDTTGITVSVNGYVGTIAGYHNSGSISKCISSESHIDLKSGTFFAGMIAGVSNGEISDCEVNATGTGLFSTASGVGCYYMGGLCGQLKGNAQRCSVNAPYLSNNLKTTTTTQIGGLVGRLYGTVKVCSVRFTDGDLKTIDGTSYNSSIYSSGTDSEMVQTGGIVGLAEETAQITDCKYDGQSISVTNVRNPYVGGIVGRAFARRNSTVSVTGTQTLGFEDLPKKEGYKAMWYTDSAFTTEYDFTNEVKENITLYAKWEAGSDAPDVWDGTASEPAYDAASKTYTITNAKELAWIARVSNDISVSGTNKPDSTSFSGYTVKLANDIYLNDAGSSSNSWTPIGVNYAFTGTFDGCNHRIYDLYCSTSAAAGLFGTIAEGGTVKNVTIDGGTVKGSTIGTIAGYNYGVIRDCNNDGCDIYPSSRGGGIVGRTDGEIYDCFNSGKIYDTGTTAYAGGIAGVAKGRIERAYNKGNVNGNRVGGIVGGGGSFVVCYCRNTGAVTGTQYAGGIYGGESSTSYGRIFISVCQNSGKVSGDEYAGGIAGRVHAAHKSADNYLPNYIQHCHNTGSISGGTCKGLVGQIWGKSSEATIYIIYNYSSSAGTYTEKSDFTGHIIYTAGNSSMLNSSGFAIDSAVNATKPHIVSLKETYKTYNIVAVADSENSTIKRTFANVDGILFAEGSRDSYVGGAIGYGYSAYAGAASKPSKLMVIADRISSISSGSSYMANAGNIIGKNGNVKFSFENAYYNSERDISATNTATAANTAIDDSGTARALKTINSAFYTNVLGLNKYKSLNMLETDETAVWVIEDGKLPELYYNCLNDITISDDIVNGTVTTDKAQEIDGEIVTVTAVPYENYVLNKIYVNGEEIIGTTFEVSGDANIYATFAEKIPEYTVSISADENASGTLTNVDETEAISLMSVAEESGVSELMASDGEEIRVDTTANEDYTVDAIFVNGEEIAGESFILNADTTVTLAVTSTSTEILATTNDAENISEYSATVSGNVLGEGEGLVRYIQYWEEAIPETVYTTEILTGGGDYGITLEMLKPETTYCYRMTEYGEIKNFTTGEEKIPMLEGVEEEAAPFTSTTYKTTTSNYKFTIVCEEALSEEILAVAIYDANDLLVDMGYIECDGESEYDVRIPIADTASYAKVFTWSSWDGMKPKSAAEVVEMSQ